MNLREKHEQLQKEVIQRFDELRSSNKEIVLFDQEDVENGDCDEYLEGRNDITGDVFDVHPILINEYGILVAEAEDKSKTYWFGIYDFANIIDQINLIELIENQLNKQNYAI